MDDHGTYVARGRWFTLADTYFRVGFGWSTADELERGLEGISRALRG
jgi:DNA-binding transcriptional MocR family regulator